MSLHTNYSQLYADASKNPFGAGEGRKEGMGHYINEWRSGNAPLDTATLTTNVLDQFTDHPVGGIGIFVTDAHNDVRLQVLLGLRKYTRNPSDLNSILFNQSFVYVNDVMEGIGSLVGFDASMLDLTADVNVHTVAHHKTLLDGDEALELIGPVADNAVQLETIKTRKAMFIPYELVHYVLGKNLSPRQAFMILMPIMETSGLLTVCKSLVDFLRVAGTLPAGGTAPLVAHDKAGRAIIAEIGLMLFMKNQVLLRDLKGLVPKTATTDPVILQLTAAVDSMTQNQLKRDEANERAALSKDKKKTITDIYSDGQINRLANICQISLADIDLLPGVYTSIAEARKENTLAVVQQKIDDLALSYGLADGPILPTSASQYFKTLRFQGIDARDISSGLLPMTFTPPGAMSAGARAVALENNTNLVSYELMMDGSHQLTSSDAKELAKTKAYVTTDWSEAKAQVECYQPVIGTILGVYHPATKAYIAAVKYSSRIFLELKDALSAKVGFKKAPSMFVYIFQAYFGGWFREQFVSEDKVPPPDLVSMFRRFSMGRNLDWLPVTMGIRVLEELRDTPVVPKAPKKPSASAAGGNGTPRVELGKSVSNTFHDPRFKEDNVFCKAIQSEKIRAAERKATAKGVAFPLTPNGEERCHTWHVKGRCYPGCERVSDHVKLETPKEVEDVYLFARAGFA